MPIDYSRYHPDWKEIVRQIKDQADNRCEFCGVENGTFVSRIDSMGRNVKGNAACTPDDQRCVRIVLTVAHLDHDISNDEPSNLRALCQKCHLAWDHVYHTANAAETRRQRKISAGELVMAS